MDALLQSAADEIYGDDKFEPDLYASSSTKGGDTMSSSSGKGGAGSEGYTKKSTLSVLMESTEQITKEDKVEVKEALGHEVQDLEPVITRQQQEREEQRQRSDSPVYGDDFDDKDHAKVEPKKTTKAFFEEEKNEDDRSEDDVGTTGSNSDDDDGRPNPNSEEQKLGFELLLACRGGNYRKVTDLLRKGASMYYRDRHGWSIVHWAAAKGHDNIVDDILSHCNRAQYLANLQDSISGWTALHVACIGGHGDVVKVLLKHGASRKRINKLGERPLDCASTSHPNYSVLSKLLS